MSAPNGMFRVTRPFFIEGVRQEKGTELALEDVEMITMLMSCSKITPADSDTARRFVVKDPFIWSETREIEVENDKRKQLRPVARLALVANRK